MSVDGKISAEEVAAWLKPREALDIVREAFGEEIDSEYAIVRRLKGGMMASVATHSVWDTREITGERLVLVHRDHWEQYSSQFHSDFWHTSDISLHISNADGRRNSATVTYYGVRFDPEGIRAIVANAPRKPPHPTVPVLPVVTNKGGRPPKEWWDDLWVEICRQIHAGELIPKKQADIERAMLDWATNHDHDLSEAGARKPARKLFAALNIEG